MPNLLMLAMSLLLRRIYFRAHVVVSNFNYLVPFAIFTARDSITRTPHRLPSNRCSGRWSVNIVRSCQVAGSLHARRARISGARACCAFVLLVLVGCGSAKPSGSEAHVDSLTYKSHVSILRAYDRLGSATFATNFYWWDSTGHARELREYFGSVIFVNFWSSLSEPSIKELIDLRDLEKKYRDTGFAVVAIPFHEPGSQTEAIERIAALTDSLHIDFPEIIGTNELAATYGGIDAIPTTVVVSRRGQVLTTIAGVRGKAVLEATIKRALSEN